MDLVLHNVPEMSDYLEQKLALVREVVFDQIESAPKAINWTCPTGEPMEY
ncbi:hypothetical protein GJ699_17195 [Duganella sp. FT80W]|jgi:hypothetical protein|uniref:Uncharacterized protein n=1 Tax=Duganella guangzhouensis TaxID=2666084 RepID=A0A6I2L1J9_9BURK|nr:hypothetical protein [Duganella guangzhouensis]MRW91732.1 hypothetical protein [Duganella guangzhouensis]